MFLPQANDPALTCRILVRLDNQLVENDPMSTLTVMATYNDTYQMGLVNVYLPLNNPATDIRFNASEPMEGATASEVIRKANQTFENLLRQLKQKMRIQ